MRKSSSIKIGVISSFIAIGLTACGSSSSGSSSSTKSKTGEISKREYVIINYHYPKDVCKSSYLKEVLVSLDAKDIVALVENSHVTCATYGKQNDGNRCLTQDLGYRDEPTCVVGVNRATNNSHKSKMTNNILILEDIKDAVIRAF